MAFFGFKWLRRPTLGEQNTGHLAVQQSAGYSSVDAMGWGGMSVQRSMNASNPANTTPGPTHKLNDPTVTGNTNVNVKLLPLELDPLSKFMVDSGQLRSF